jgi:uncharacterized damage-inducible protein DinB
MSHKEDWLTKEFKFNFPATRYIEFLSFLRKTPDRLKALLKDVPPDLLTRREGDSWSIQENAGHFLTVESLFLGRLEDYNQDAQVLRPAEFEDNRTDKANYNQKEIGWILEAFSRQRAIYIQQLETLQPDEFGKVALHPRLNTPMRICDMLHFHAEHDHHHLERIEELKGLWGLG